VVTGKANKVTTIIIVVAVGKVTTNLWIWLFSQGFTQVVRQRKTLGFSFDAICWEIKLWPTFSFTITVTITWNLEYTRVNSPFRAVFVKPCFDYCESSMVIGSLNEILDLL